MGADYSFYVKTIETHARAFFKVIIFSISSVCNLPVVRVMAITKRIILVLRVILQPRAEKVLKVLCKLNFQLFLSTSEEKVAKRICLKKEKLI